MKFELKNIGIIKKSEIELNNFTVLFGKNNTGKTYLTYSIFGFLNKIMLILFKNEYQIIDEKIKSINKNSEDEFDLDIELFLNELSDILTKESKNYSNELYNVFSTNPDVFKDSVFNFLENFNKEQIIENAYYHTDNYITFSKIAKNKFINIKTKLDINTNYLLNSINGLKNHLLYTLIFNVILKNNLFYSQIILTAERVGIDLFQKEIQNNKVVNFKNLEKNIKENTFNSQEDLIKFFDNNVSKYSLAIENNIDLLNDISNITKSNSFLKNECPELLDYIENILGINYLIEDGRLLILDKKNNSVIPSYLASTSVRSLFGLYLWLKHKVKKGEMIFIDEPELNLHPEIQIKLTRLFVMLVNAGVKIWITTHSDYIIKELNNLLMLSNEFENKNEILKELNYSEKNILSKNDINFYLSTDEGKFNKIDTDEYGVLKTTFDETIIDINTKSNRLITLVDNLLNN